MRIFTDTNVLPLDGNLDTLGFTTLVTLASEHGHRLVLPSLVVIEAEAQCRTRAKNAIDHLRQAGSAVRRFTAIELPSVLTADEIAADFRAALNQRFDVVPLPSGAAEEALKREAFRLPPAHKKGGARDAAIWLTVKSEHVNSADESGFLTNNHADFSDPANQSAFHPLLAEELGDRARRFHYYPSAGALVEGLGSRTKCEFNEEEIGRSPVVHEVVAQAMLVLGGDRMSYQLADPVRLSSITRSHCFRLQSHVLAILNTVWETRGLAVDRRLSVATLTFQFRAMVPIQLWLRLDIDGQGDPRSAGLHSVGLAEIEWGFGDTESAPYGWVIQPTSAVDRVPAPGLVTLWTPPGAIEAAKPLDSPSVEHQAEADDDSPPAHEPAGS